MKRKVFSILFVLVLVVSFSLVTAVAAGADSVITIDGNLSEGEWDSYFWFTDNSEGPGTGYDDDPLPVFSGYVTRDDENLYLAFDVQDTTPNTNRDFLYVTIDIPPAGVFNDSVDALYWGSIPVNPSFFGEAYLTSDPYPWDRSQRLSTWGTDGCVVAARTITSTNRYYELEIPLSAIGASLGDTVGLKIQARGGQYLSPTDPQVVNFYPDMPAGITPTRADTRVEVEGNFYQLTLAAPGIEAIVEIDPKTLNLRAQEKWITAYIGLPEGYSVEDIDIGTVQLVYGEGKVDASWGDIQDSLLMVKFDWATAAQMLQVGDSIELSIVGKVNDVPFEGIASIRVISPGKG